VITLAFELADRHIRVPILLWRRVILDLRHRGNRHRESGAFLLGVMRGSSAITKGYRCYDDLDPNAYQGGGIAFHAHGCAALWSYCREKQLDILADIHTHGGADTRQSDIDRRNPMIPMVDHTALIVPHFAHTPWWSLEGVGVHVYMGNFKWRSFGQNRSQRIRLTLW
jgi:proteasome lid subunit RPN8/RPN11